MQHRSRRRRLILTGLGFAMASCAAETPRSSADPQGVTRVDWLENEASEIQLRDALGDAAARDVQVNLLRPFKATEVPTRLSSWLTAVAQHGGRVAVVPPEAGQAHRLLTPDMVISLLNPLLEKLFAMIQDRLKYAPAAGHDALLVVAPGTDQVLSVIFRRRPA